MKIGKCLEDAVGLGGWLVTTEDIWYYFSRVAYLCIWVQKLVHSVLEQYCWKMEGEGGYEGY